jgi:diguanylate cyclase (GGDEF)-like protein
MRILFVEDHAQLAEQISDALISQRYVVDRAEDGLAGWDLAVSIDYDLILMDVMLPKLDGVSLCRKLRTEGNSTPIMLLTARGTHDDKVQGLDAGADDYLVKPVGLGELMARVRALLRRSQAVASPILEWGSLKFNPSSCEVTYGEYPLQLTPKELSLLELFLRNHQRVHSRSAILDHVWAFDDNPPGEDTVKAHIKGLRHKLKEVGAADLIETVYGMGYRLNPAFLKLQPKSCPVAISSTPDESLFADPEAALVEEELPIQVLVLAISPDDSCLESLQMVLANQPLQLLSLQDSTQFWPTLKSLTPDLVILDADLPNHQAAQLCQAIRRDRHWNWLPILWLTAQTAPETIHHLYTLGIDDYAQKPLFASEVATRIQNRLERTRVLRTLVEVDRLTGVVTRQRCVRELNKLLQLAKVSQQPLSFAILDLDRLKLINQQYGYSVGDRILHQMGRWLQQRLRQEDCIGRWSGAEFVVGLYGMTRSQAVEWLAETLEALRKLPLNPSDEEPLTVTFSAGVAQYPIDAPSLLALYQTTQVVCNQAKTLGGNRVLSADWPPPSIRSPQVPMVTLIYPDTTEAEETLKALETRGYSYQWMQRGEVALQQLTGGKSNLRTQVILLSATLPDIDGLKVLEQLSTHKVTRQTRIIWLSEQGDDAQDALNQGVFDYVVAPWSACVLMQYVRRAFGE